MTLALDKHALVEDEHWTMMHPLEFNDKGVAIKFFVFTNRRVFIVSTDGLQQLPFAEPPEQRTIQ